MSKYLSQRKRAGYPDTLNFYAVLDKWNPETKKQDRKQIFLGSKFKKIYRFNANAMEHMDLFINSEHATAFLNWLEGNKANEEDPRVVSIEDVVNSEIRDAGTDLVLSDIANSLGLSKKLIKVFGEEQSNLLLSLAYYCAAEEDSPLYRAATWSEDQKLPGNVQFTEVEISKLLFTTKIDNITAFLKDWLKNSKTEERLTLLLTPEPSYSRRNKNVMLGCNSNLEVPFENNFLMIVSQKTRLPLWYEQFPEELSDITTMVDAVNDLVQTGTTSKKLVLDRRFAIQQTVLFLLDNGFKFTVQKPLEGATNYLEIIRKAYESNKFLDPSKTLTLFDDYETAWTLSCTDLMKIEGHRLYLHMYYTESYRVRNDEIFMTRLHDVAEKLKAGKKLTDPQEHELAEKYFAVKVSPKKGITVTSLVDKIAEHRNNDAGFFAILSNQFENSKEALNAYKLRDGIEKRFDNLINDADLTRLKMHSCHCQQVRMFIQFLAEILRCRIFYLMQSGLNLPKKIKTITDLLWEIKSIKWIEIQNQDGFYRFHTQDQKIILDALGIKVSDSQCMTFDRSKHQ